MGTKSVGAVTALQFAAEAAQRGATVCDPIGDDSPYDFALDVPGKGFFRVQVKSASLSQSGYQLNAHPRIPCQGKNGKLSSKVVKYKQGEVDALVSKIGPDWYIFDNVHLLPATIKIVSSGNGKFAVGKNNWHRIGL